MEDIERLEKLVQQYKRGIDWYKDCAIECDISVAINGNGNHTTWMVKPKDKSMQEKFSGWGDNLDEAIANFRASLEDYIWQCFANGGLVCFGNGDIK